MTRWAKQFEAQRRIDPLDQWALTRKITDDALRTVDAFKKDRVQILQAMSDRIGYIEDKKESVLEDFKGMLSHT